MRKGDSALLLGILLLLSVQWIFFRPAAGRPDSWKARETAVERRIEKTFSGNLAELHREISRRPDLRWRFQLASYGTTLFLAGVAAALIRLLFCLLTRRPLYRKIGRPAMPAWGLAQILRIAGWVWVAMSGAAVAEAVLFAFFRPAWLDRPFVALANTLLADCFVLAAAFFLFRRVKPAQPPERGAGVGFAVVSYLTFLPFLFLLLVGLAALWKSIHYAPAPQPVFTLFLSESRSTVLVWLLVLVTLVGPVAEELFFRGFLYGWLRVRWGIPAALVLSAAVFALLHTDLVAFVPIFALGLLFGWVYEQTGTLAAPIAIHVLHNGVMLYMAFLVKTLVELGA